MGWEQWSVDCVWRGFSLPQKFCGRLGTITEAEPARLRRTALTSAGRRSGVVLSALQWMRGIAASLHSSCIPNDAEARRASGQSEIAQYKGPLDPCGNPWLFTFFPVLISLAWTA
jgi:hypothetical protein